MQRRTLIALAAVATLIAPAAASPATAGPPGDTGRTLQAKLDAVIAAGMPGAFAEVRDRRRTWTPTAGVADVATGAPVRDGMRHRVGSITKTFVSATVLQLAGERRIGLDTPIGRYLPRLVPGEVGRQVTVRMLLNHTSGIGDYDTELIKTVDDIVRLGETTFAPSELVRIGLGAAPTGEPGAAFSYSNTNYILAGLIVEKVTGHSYRAEVQRRIIRPLGLRDTYFQGSDLGIRGPHMHAYVPWVDGDLRDFTRYNMTWAWAAGELISTGRDLNVFYRALLTGRVLSPALLAEMQTATGAEGYGLGLYSVDLPCGRFWGHDGGTVGHQTVSWHSPDGERQVTYAHSMAWYQTSPTEPHPIDVAYVDFLVTALCGTGAAQTFTAPALPRTVDLTRPF
ncbi:serine hydrolase domain-containing protein [Paractinoplanes rishiriensis]|uniref:Serine hydrolase n=1 Tax=Paractinoplanes rishiriensis TaxID=1050105 RepID=A0A919JSS8_9ACTN|nr:serine hydrolase domain-containing protein [Actinoplanes rishiriensis]GIE92687.1 serine hydrolase [Actinoplanes rishiriensis]